MFDRNKIYGYTTEQVEALGRYPDDNWTPQDGDENDILTIEEIKRMFPEQNLVLTNITYDENDIVKHDNHIISAAVVKYHCSLLYATEYSVEHGQDRYTYFVNNTGYESRHRIYANLIC